MLNALVDLGPVGDGDLIAEADRYVESVRTLMGRGDAGLVRQAEVEVQKSEKVFEFEPDGKATLRAAGHVWSAGKFETPTLGMLRERAERARVGRKSTQEPRLRFWVLDGAAAATDIGSLQAHAGENCLFQVASQLNCLEATGPFVCPVSHYLTDPTQGPRASVSAFPGTLLRHYAAPGLNGERFVQATNAAQIELLGEVCSPEVARAQNGYLMDDCVHNAPAFLEALKENFNSVKVGFHDDVEVVLGGNWSGGVVGRPRIGQVFTSTVAGGGYGGENLGDYFVPLCREMLKAAYVGTLLSAAAAEKSVVVLTLIGGGVFGNPIEVIWEAIEFALATVEPLLAVNMDVFVNGRDLSKRLDQKTMMSPVGKYGGLMVVFDKDSSVRALVRA
ncbi:MAG: hypothetical protein IPK82_21725 [Polyangiaceae bacterium]|nr:hypothetical protein [Polyangiaceae bacterium]